MSRRKRIDWSTAPPVFVPVVRPACPTCDSEHYRHVRGAANGDGSTTERVLCAACGAPYVIVREYALPELGNLD